MEHVRRRFPLRTKAAFLSATGAAVMIAVAWGLSEADAERWTITAANIGTLLALFGVFTTTGEDDVTPVTDPRDMDGTRLVRSDGTLPIRSRGEVDVPAASPEPGHPAEGGVAIMRTSTRMRSEHGGIVATVLLVVLAIIGAIVILSAIFGGGSADAAPLLGVAGVALRS